MNSESLCNPQSGRIPTIHATPLLLHNLRLRFRRNPKYNSESLSTRNPWMLLKNVHQHGRAIAYRFNSAFLPTLSPACDCLRTSKEAP
jgi:hypothetical protein